jgi:hypothetical protein
LINDLLNTKEASDGTKHKEKAKDKDTGVTYEKYAHYNDAMDYLIIKLFKQEFEEYKTGNVSARPTLGRRVIEEGHNY